MVNQIQIKILLNISGVEYKVPVLYLMGFSSLRLRQTFIIVSIFSSNIIETSIFPQCTFPSLTVEDLTIFHIFVILRFFIVTFPIFAKTISLGPSHPYKCHTRGNVINEERKRNFIFLVD